MQQHLAILDGQRGKAKTSNNYLELLFLDPLNDSEPESRFQSVPKSLFEPVGDVLLSGTHPVTPQGTQHPHHCLVADAPQSHRDESVLLAVSELSDHQLQDLLLHALFHQGGKGRFFQRRLELAPPGIVPLDELRFL